MSISAATLRTLMAAGVTGEALLAVADAIEADLAAAIPVVPGKTRSAGAERQARYRSKLSAQVTESDVTSDGHNDVTGVTPPPQRDKSNPPSPSLRSDNPRTRGEWFSELWSVLPHRKGDDKQPAEQKFCRLLRDSKQPEILAAEILEGARRYAIAETETDRQFIRATLVWLNKGGWKNDYTEPVGPGKWPGSGGQRRPRYDGPTMSELAGLNSTSDLFKSPSDEPRDRSPTEFRSDPSDPRVRGFAGRLSEPDGEHAYGQVIDLQTASAHSR